MNVPFHSKVRRIAYAYALSSLYILFASILILKTAHSAPNVPMNFDGWVTDALAKLETDGITGGFHRQTAPLSRAEVAQIIRQAESRIRAGSVVPSEIDRKLLEKLKQAFSKELASSDGRIMGFFPQLRASEKKNSTST